MEGEVDIVGAMETKISILNFSDEILVQICLYLTSEDLVSLSSTCKRWNGVLCERKLVRFVNLKAAYSLTLDSLKKFVQPRLRCQNIQTISFASCYWLNSSDIRWAILRLSNLKNLHVNDTNFSISHLAYVLNQIKSIESISWTFDATKKTTVKNVEMLSEELQTIKSFNLWVKGSCFFLPLLLSKCFSLEELKLSAYKLRSFTERSFCYREPIINLPNIKSLILNVSDGANAGWNYFLSNFIIKITEYSSNPWNCLWLDARREISKYTVDKDYRNTMFRNCNELYAESLDFEYEEFATLLLTKPLEFFKYGYSFDPSKIKCLLPDSKITHILWKNELVPSALPIGLKHLCIECQKRKSPNLGALFSYKVLPHLTCLSVPACMFLSYTSVPMCSFQKKTFLKKQSRQSHLNKDVNNLDCLLRKFTEYAPNVRELEVKCDEKCTILSKSHSTCLQFISNWSQLESLFIQNVSLIDISVLVEVCTACPKIRRFGLHNFGMAVGISQLQILVQAIKLLQNLEDFQLHNPVMDNVMIIVQALAELPKLRRVCIIGERTAAYQNIAAYLNLLEKCPSLVFLFVRLAAISQKMTTDFQRELKAKFLDNRKSLWASIEGIQNDDYWENIPTIHCYEMIADPALLTIVPPMKGWCNFLSMDCCDI